MPELDPRPAEPRPDQSAPLPSHPVEARLVPGPAPGATPEAPAAAGGAPARGGIHRRLYNWVIHWAETPHGAVALFLLAFTESSFFPIPPDVLLIALVLGARTRWWWLALICTFGSALGGVAGYGIGYYLMDTAGWPIIRFYHAEKYFETVQDWYRLYDYWIVFIAAFSPIPYKVFTISSGMFGMNLLGFAVISFIGRGARFFLVAGLLYWFGPPIKRFIDRHLDWLAIVFVVLLIGGFVALKVLR